MSDVTQILRQIESGDPSAADQLLPLVYDELRRLAAAPVTYHLRQLRRIQSSLTIRSLKTIANTKAANPKMDNVTEMYHR